MLGPRNQWANPLLVEVSIGQGGQWSYDNLQQIKIYFLDTQDSHYTIVSLLAVANTDICYFDS